ncbi:MAG: MATE family efflux transporter [Lachnospiraceae bacterium]|nr:MATE family efflux transporter [Lachnospiraceae bacterium]
MNNVKENKMGTMPVKPLIINMSLPIMVSMLVQALYNVVDSIFVAQISESALTAVTIAFPLQNLMIAVGSGTGVGVNAILSRALGEKNKNRSDAAGNMAILLALFNYFIFLCLALLIVTPFINSQTDNAEIRSLGNIYLGIVMTFSLGVFLQITFERLLQATGRTVLSMISQLVGAIINIILDPIMIFGLLGFPKLGIAGAAIATVSGQCIAAVLGLYLNVKLNKEISFSLRQVFKPHFEIIGHIYLIGIPSILMMSIGSVMTYMMNLILMAFSSTATTVFGAYFKLQSFFFMPIFGMNNGMIPILAYNYGAKKKDRINEALRFALILAVCIMSIGTITFEIIPNVLLDLFNPSKEMMYMGIRALRTIALHFPIAAISIVFASIFQAFGKSFYSLLVSLIRQLFILIPAAYLLSLTGNVNNVWWSFLIAECVSLVLSLVFFKRLYKSTIERL